jgi:hypothetical protein
MSSSNEWAREGEWPRPSGPRTISYDVLAGGSVAGCIKKLSAAPKDAQWMRTLAYRQRRDRSPSRGYEPTCEAAIAAFVKSWRLE